MTDFQLRRFLADMAESMKKRANDPAADMATVIQSARQALDLAERETDHRPGLMVTAGRRLRIG